MNLKITLNAVLLFITVLTTNLFSQSRPQRQTNYLSTDQVYLNYGDKKIKIADISPANIIKLFGKPDYIKKGEGIEGLEVGNNSYHYFNGDIVFKGNSLLDIDILNPGWTFTFNINNKITGPLTNNSPTAALKALFPISWANQRKNLVNVFLKTPSGQITDTSLTFDIEGDHIRYANLFGEES